MDPRATCVALGGLLGLAVTTLLAAGCQAPEAASPDAGEAVMDRALSVNDLHDRAAALSGQRVRVRGFGRLLINTTLIGCFPARCDCNRSSGSLRLGARPKPDIFADYLVEVSELQCAGDECTATCTPFDPSALAYELVGTFSLGEDGKRLVLGQLDLGSSSELAGDSGDLATLMKAPLRLGSVSISTKRN